MLFRSMVMTLNACGKTNSDSVSESTETEMTTEESGTASSADIEYDASDYVTLGEYKNMEIALDNDYAVTDQNVVDYVNNNVIANYPYYTDSDKTVVESGDVANIDYEGLLNGEAFDGGTATGYDLEIGSGSFIEGFEDGLIGAEVGKETDLNLTFPESYSNTDLAGQDVVFKVTVNSIKQAQDMTYDTLTDDYVTYLSDKVGASYATVDDLTSDIRAYLEEQANSSKSQATRNAVVDKLSEVCTVNALPEGLLDARMQEYIDTFEDKYCTDTTLEDYLSTTYNTTEADFRSQIQTEMESEIGTQLILEAIAKAENVEFDEDGFNQYVSNMVSSYGYDSEDTLYTNYASTPEAGKKYLQTIYLCNKALTQIMDTETVTYNAAEDTESTEAVPSEAATEAK